MDAMAVAADADSSQGEGEGGGRGKERGQGYRTIVVLVGRWSEPPATNTSTALKLVLTGKGGEVVKVGGCYAATIERVHAWCCCSAA